MIDARSRVTEALSTLGAEGAAPGAEELMALLYDELGRLAGAYMKRERADHTLQPTAVVHEAFLKLVDQSRVDWQGTSHFFAVCAQAMRRVLVDHARGRARAKRGADWQRVTLSGASDSARRDGVSFEELLGIDRALDRLAELDERQARVVELRFFAGLTVEEVASSAC